MLIKHVSDTHYGLKREKLHYICLYSIVILWHLHTLKFNGLLVLF